MGYPGRRPAAPVQCRPFSVACAAAALFSAARSPAQPHSAGMFSVRRTAAHLSAEHPTLRTRLLGSEAEQWGTQPPGRPSRHASRLFSVPHSNTLPADLAAVAVSA